MFNLFGENEINEKLSILGDPLEKLSKSIDFETFRPLLHELLFKSPKGHGGRKPYDYVLMFKILIVQRYYNLSDDQMEYQMLDRYSFRRFSGFQKVVFLCLMQKQFGISVTNYRNIHVRKNFLIASFTRFKNKE